MHWPPRSPLHFYLMHLGSTAATGLPYMYFSRLPVLLFRWTLSALRFYCIMSVSSRRRYIELFISDSFVTVCVIGIDVLSRRRYQWVVFLLLPARSAGHIGGYCRLDDTFPVSAQCMDCSSLRWAVRYRRGDNTTVHVSPILGVRTGFQRTVSSRRR